MSDTKTIAFFSSDAYPLYKIDIFRSLALPNGYTLQFRYNRRHISQNIFSDISSLIDREGCIFFVPNNNLEIPLQQRNLGNKISIRKVKIVEATYDSLTEQILFFLELGEFQNFEIPVEEKDLLPENDIYVSEIAVTDRNDNSWVGRVDAIKEFFPNNLFFNFTKIKGNKSDIVPKYSRQTNSSYFELDDEALYGAEVSFYDLNQGNSIFMQENFSDLLRLELPNRFNIKAPLDKKIFPLQTLPSRQEKDIVSLKLGEESLIEDYSLDLEFRIHRSV